MNKFTLTISRRGLPCLWESGGGKTNTGSATIIADQNGMPKKPIYIRSSGSLSCSDHALIPICIGDTIVETSHHRGDHTIKIHKIAKINKDNCETEIIDIHCNGEWENGGIPPYQSAVEAAIDKAEDYHCREPYYIKE